MSHDNTHDPLAVESVKPYDERHSKTGQVREMFDSIAPAYDFMNHAMTLGIDKWWRRKAVNALRHHAPVTVLDVATGTGDFALSIYRRLRPAAVTGIDLSQGMLAVARDKVKKAGMDSHITFEQADCLALPFDDASFDALTVAFGVRNFEHLQQGYEQMWRVLRPGGVLCVLELSTPRRQPVRWLYDLYTLHIIPWVGALKSHDKSAYRYLPLSIAASPQGEAMTTIMEAAGFIHCTFKRMTLGTCTLYLAEKPT